MNKPLHSYLITYEGRNGLISRAYLLSVNKVRAKDEAQELRRSAKVVRVERLYLA